MKSTGSRLPRVLWLATAAFIVYGTTIPFRFVPNLTVAADNVARLRLNPLISPDTGRKISAPDFVSNVWLFTPFGCFGMWTLARPRSRIRRTLILIALGALLSAAVETLQLFTVDRVASLSDVVANSAGTAVGAVAGLLLRASAMAMFDAGAPSAFVRSASFYPFLIAGILVCAGAWEPFNVTLDVGSVIPKIRSLLHDPIQRTAPSDEGVSLLRHLLFTATLFIALKEARVRKAAALSAAIGLVTAVALESSQLLIQSRMPGGWDAGVGAAGAILGVGVGEIYSSRRYAPAWPAALVGATFLTVAMQQLSPYVPVVGEPRPFQWMPFLNYYAYTTAETVSHSAELLLMYIPLGFGLALAATGVWGSWIVPLGAAGLIAAPVEYLQRFVGGRYPDVTDIAMSVGGAWIGAWTATQGWRSFDAEMKTISRRATVAAAPSRPRALPARDSP